MSDLDRILPLWRELESAGADYVLATVVAVEGSSYRKPGARMVLAEDGRRAGAGRGGCLEAEVARRAWWLTSNGPVVERYSTVRDDGPQGDETQHDETRHGETRSDETRHGQRPYGSGCGGVVSLLLERRATAGSLLAALQAAFNQRTPLAIATVLEGPSIGARAFAGWPLDSGAAPWPHASESRASNGAGREPLRNEIQVRLQNGIQAALQPKLQALAHRALESRAPVAECMAVQGRQVNAWADYRPARPGLWVFGAGDDAQPLARLARELGWFVSVADGRSNLATPARFPAADRVSVLPIAALPAAALKEMAKSDAVQTSPLQARAGSFPPETPLSGLRCTDAAAVMTHSFEQDARLIAALLSLASPPAYLGVLGPRRRTLELVAEAARLLRVANPSRWAEQSLTRIHAPMGLDLGAETPSAIALSALAEMQRALANATGLPLTQLRAAQPTHA
jgi:xanthine/CO dehydrogenase XdhC/CoxF family maturation factor